MSLRLRLLLATGVVALVALIVADLVTYSSLRTYLVGQLDNDMEQVHPAIEACLDSGARPSADLVQDEAPGMFFEERTPSGKVVGTVVPAFSISSGGGVTDPLPALPRTFPELHPAKAASSSTAAPGPPPGCGANGAAGGAAGAGGASGGGLADGTGVAPSGGTPGVPTTTISPGASATSPSQEQVVYLTVGSRKAGGPSYRVRVSTLSNGNLMVLGLTLTGTDNTLRHLLEIEALVTGAALLLAIGLGFWLVRLGMRPLVEVERTAEAIAEGDLAARVPSPRRPGTEIGRLAVVLNRMLGRIQGAFAERDRTEAELRRSEERMRQFLADASHELRTPLAAVSAYAELFERGGDQHPEDLPRILGGIHNETDRMAQLVADLLLLANLDEGRPLEQRPAELVRTASEAVDAARAVGPGWPVALRAEHPVEVVGDAARIRQVLDNLLANVRAHTPAGTPSEVVVRQEGDEAVIEVVDHGRGPGLGDEAMARVFERFYRTEASRTRARGGAGLGLAIVQAIVQAHGGSVSVARTAGGGSTFTIRLPASGDGGGNDRRPEEGSGSTGRG